jgi:hypothetical protein
MPQFQDLPVELLADICSAILKPSLLVSVCTVNKAFSAFATPRLYERVYVYSWHKEGKVKVGAIV